MSEPFLAEVKIVAFNFAPRGWAFCDGQILPINQNQSLYSLLGTTYGGDGRTSFALPDLRGRAPIFQGAQDGTGPSYSLGQKSGDETVTLSEAQIPSHQHAAQASASQGDAPIIPNNVYADSPAQIYGAPNNLVAMRDGTITATGGDQAHDNMQPWLALNFCIALMGLFPSRN